jgi:GTP cyclohydrolase I
MRQKETMLNTLLKENKVTMSKLSDDEIGNDHVSANIETPLRDDAFEMSDTKKIEKIEFHFKEIMHTLGLDLTDDSLKGTPNRVAKMYIQEFLAV